VPNEKAPRAIAGLFHVGRSPGSSDCEHQKLAYQAASGDQMGTSGLRPKLWMVLTWGAILLALTGICAVYGGRNCEVPESGPFHWLLKGHKFVATHAGRIACREVK
jgi:hypothetical protein